jgi:hypothetical protein
LRFGIGFFAASASGVLINAGDLQRPSRVPDY